MIDSQELTTILDRLGRCRIGVFGDLFLDRYLEIDGGLDEPSIETGLTAYQVTRVRSQPGAAGTVINNLEALGVGKIVVFSMRGEDGEGFELDAALGRMPRVERSAILPSPHRRTPTYTKPMYRDRDGSQRELNRLDIKNHAPLPVEIEDELIRRLEAELPHLDALVVLDQVSQKNCGVVTDRVIQRLEILSALRPDLLILADSRTRIGSFRGVSIKPNRDELAQWLPGAGGLPRDQLLQKLSVLSKERSQGIFCTLSEEGIVAVLASGKFAGEPAIKVKGPIDVVGAGDSVSAAIAAAFAAGAGLEAALGLAMLVASVTVRQIGTTGTAPPESLRKALSEL